MRGFKDICTLLSPWLVAETISKTLLQLLDIVASSPFVNSLCLFCAGALISSVGSLWLCLSILYISYVHDFFFYHFFFYHACRFFLSVDGGRLDAVRCSAEVEWTRDAEYGSAKTFCPYVFILEHWFCYLTPVGHNFFHIPVCVQGCPISTFVASGSFVVLILGIVVCTGAVISCSTG